MNGKSPLGRLERVDLREYWEREDTDFTPWLAQEENIIFWGHSIDWTTRNADYTS